MLHPALSFFGRGDDDVPGMVGDDKSDAFVTECTQAGGDPGMCQKAADGDFKGVAQQGGQEGGAAVCTMLGAPEAAPACSYVGGVVAGKIYDAVSSLVSGGGCQGPLCDIPPPELTYPPALAKDKVAIGYVPAMVASADYGGTDPNEKITGLKAGTLARCLASALYIKIANGTPLGDIVHVATDNCICCGDEHGQIGPGKPGNKDCCAIGAVKPDGTSRCPQYTCPDGKVYNKNEDVCLPNPCDANNHWEWVTAQCIPGAPVPQRSQIPGTPSLDFGAPGSYCSDADAIARGLDTRGVYVFDASGNCVEEPQGTDMSSVVDAAAAAVDAASTANESHTGRNVAVATGLAVAAWIGWRVFKKQPIVPAPVSAAWAKMRR